MNYVIRSVKGVVSRLFEKIHFVHSIITITINASRKTHSHSKGVSGLVISKLWKNGI